LPQTPIIYGIGFNYKSHIAEGKMATPAHPTVFTKPPDALNGPFSDVIINPSCLHLDYEGELVIVVGQDCKNLANREEALAKILGYTVGNDVSSRWWQMPQQGGSHGFAKSFDGFAPVGPVIAAPKAVGGHGQGGIKSQTIITRVNGEERQRARLDDLLFDAAELLIHLTTAVTVRAGTLIMTGTPGGVGFFMKPQMWLEKGDIVDVSISGIGVIRNKFQ
jgi:2-keto-4-pentenoate hydratase/2-oxohepta-3-ene-1,7-dioic acid hydratase in catechol pathway